MPITRGSKFKELHQVFNTSLPLEKRAEHLDRGFHWNTTCPIVRESVWSKLYSNMRYEKRDCTEALIEAFSKVPELVQFLPQAPEDILWE